jgi:asparagine synthase (glutamine-hydrolysing)
MCGIAGFTGAPDPTRLKKMTDSIFHRGPDDDGRIETPNFSVGYRRLAMIDLTSGIYPLTNEDGSIEVESNGEIYNFKELKAELIKLNHKFKTNCDTEVIAHGYEEWGIDVVHKMRGMFVSVIYDKKKESLIILRDRIGIKPFYYAEVDGRLAFSSEIKGILAGFDVDREPDESSVYKFLAYRIHDTDKNTFFKNIKRLLPGHFMVIESDGNFRIEKYWNPTFNQSFSPAKSDAEYAGEFREKFLETVDLHLISDVPVGTTLSGGLDSSGITSLAAKLYKERYHGSKMTADATDSLPQKMYSFSAVHPGETVNEEEYIDAVVDYTGVESVKVVPNVDKFWEELDTWTYFQEEPVISGAPYAYYVVMREARKKVTVILSGQGGDELLAGYIPYFMSYWQSAFDQGQPIQALSELYKGSDIYFKYILSKIDGWMHSKNQIRPTDYLNKPGEVDIPAFKHKRNLNERLFQDVTSTTTPCLLRYEDKNSMANSLESRVPFYDHVMAEFIFNLPIDQKIKHGWNRFVYRNAMKGLMPEKNRLRRSKIGFTNPEWEWIERKKEKFIEIFSSAEFKSRKFWNADKVLAGFKDALENDQRGDILFFWRVFSVEMWLRTFVDKFETIDTSKLVHFR